MQALVTGASSGIGREMAKYLSEKGYDLILVARNEEKMIELAKEIKTKSKIFSVDLSKKENVLEFCKQIENEDINVFINNAGFGVFGDFSETNLNKEIDLIETNIIALHILTKLAIKKMKAKNNGYILNVSSVASFAPRTTYGHILCFKGLCNISFKSNFKRIKRSTIKY